MCRPLEQWATQHPITELERCAQSPGPPSLLAVQLVAAQSGRALSVLAGPPSPTPGRAEADEDE